MYWLVIVAVEMVVLFRSARVLQHAMLVFLTKTFKKPKISIWLLALLFFPGTYFHEISHLVVARLLGIPAHLSSLKPKREANDIVMGSVSLAKTGSFRRFLVGVAPFVLGLGGLWVLTYFFYLRFVLVWWHWLVWAYLVFQLGNTIFLSRQDMQGAWVYLVPTFSLVCGLVVYFGVPGDVVLFLKQVSILLLIPISINLLASCFFVLYFHHGS